MINIIMKKWIGVHHPLGKTMEKINNRGKKGKERRQREIIN